MERRCRARDPPSEIYGYPLNLDAGETEAIAGPHNILPNKNLVTTFHLRRFLAIVFLVSNSRKKEKKERKKNEGITKTREVKVSSKCGERIRDGK